MSRRRVSPAQQLELKAPPPAPPPGRRPIVLELGPRNWGIAQWLKDERDVPVYRITHRDIRATSTAATIARKLQRENS
jgi:hypothetical protein